MPSDARTNVSSATLQYELRAPTLQAMESLFASVLANRSSARPSEVGGMVEIPLDLNEEQLRIIRAAARLRGMCVNEFINWSVREVLLGMDDGESEQGQGYGLRVSGREVLDGSWDEGTSRSSAR